MTLPFAVSVMEPSQAGEVRRMAKAMAQALGFGETAAGHVAIVVTEAATNLVKHARGGDLLVRPLSNGATPALELLALDKGPGMADVAACLRDGYSTAGSAGTGLGAIARMTSAFDIFSVPGQGTALWAQIAAQPASDARGPFEIGAVSVPKPGEQMCGDDWSMRLEPDGASLLVADGLGHGPLAAAAAQAATRAFVESQAMPPAERLRALHASLRSTRGAAAAIAEVRPATQEVRYAGVGNISGLLYREGRARHMVSHNGTLGHQLHSVHEFVYPWSPDTLLVMYSDGLTSQVGLERYPGLQTRHPSLIAGVLYRDFARGRDDATVVVVRQREWGATA